MIAPRRLCRTADGQIVEADDPAAAFLLVCEGGEVPHADVDDVAAFLGDTPPDELEKPTERTVTFGKVELDEDDTKPKRARKPRS